MKLLRLFIISLSIALLSAKAFAAACCSGGFAAPSLIAGEQKAQISESFSYSEEQAYVDNQGLWHQSSEKEQLQTLRIEAAHLITDRWQAGLAAPFVQREKAGNSASGFGDISATLGYEMLTDWTYDPWQPKAITYLQVTVPTGKSIYEFSDPLALDARGRGFYSLGLGSLLTKNWLKWDAFVNFEIHKGFTKTVDNSQIHGDIEPGYGGSLIAGFAYNTEKWRLGTSLGSAQEDAVKVMGLNGGEQKSMTASLSASYFVSTDLVGTLLYTDQTLFGSPQNSSLQRSVSLQLQQRWQR
jgi:hypothetical protein